LNPYVSFALAMCAIVFLALFATGYMATYFNRKAKGDLLTALTPLALELGGEVDLDEATAAGTYRGHLSSGKVTNVGRGPDRVFETRLIDGAGGSKWKWTASWPKAALDASAIETSLESDNPALEPRIAPATQELTLGLLKGPGWLQFEYDPGPGHVMLTTPMRTRRDIPSQPVFHNWLEGLYKIADINRSAQA
jgi:hypothetical protein